MRRPAILVQPKKLVIRATHVRPKKPATPAIRVRQQIPAIPVQQQILATRVVLQQLRLN